LNETTVAQTVLFPDLFDRPLVATFDQAYASSDGGAILLKPRIARSASIRCAGRRCPTRGRRRG
jgi:hypothetical protein